MKISEQLLEEFRQYLRNCESSPRTIEKYMRDVRRIKSLIGAELQTREQLISFKEKLQKAGYAVRSVNSMISAINTFVAFCGRPDWKLKFLKLQRTVFTDGTREMRKTDYTRLVKQARRMGNERLELILQTICTTGIRVSEIRAITVESLRTGIAIIILKGKIRQILIPRTLIRLLKAYCRKNGVVRGCVFQTKYGNVPDRSNLWKQMKKLAENARVSKRRVFPHNLRSLFARSFYQKYRDIVRLADILGHSSIDTTRIYTIKNSRSELQRLEALGLFVQSTT